MAKRKKRKQSSTARGRNMIIIDDLRVTPDQIAQVWDNMVEGFGRGDWLPMPPDKWLWGFADSCFQTGQMNQFTEFRKIVEKKGSDIAKRFLAEAMSAYRPGLVVAQELAKAGMQYEQGLPYVFYNGRADETPEEIAYCSKASQFNDIIPDDELTKRDLDILSDLGPGWRKVRCDIDGDLYVDRTGFDPDKVAHIFVM